MAEMLSRRRVFRRYQSGSGLRLLGVRIQVLIKFNAMISREVG